MEKNILTATCYFYSSFGSSEVLCRLVFPWWGEWASRTSSLFTLLWLDPCLSHSDGVCQFGFAAALDGETGVKGGSGKSHGGTWWCFSLGMKPPVGPNPLPVPSSTPTLGQAPLSIGLASPAAPIPTDPAQPPGPGQERSGCPRRGHLDCAASWLQLPRCLLYPCVLWLPEAAEGSCWPGPSCPP